MATLPPLDVLLVAALLANALTDPPLLAFAETEPHSSPLALALPPELAFTFKLEHVPYTDTAAPLETSSCTLPSSSP